MPWIWAACSETVKTKMEILFLQTMEYEFKTSKVLLHSEYQYFYPVHWAKPQINFFPLSFNADCALAYEFSSLKSQSMSVSNGL